MSSSFVGSIRVCRWFVCWAKVQAANTRSRYGSCAFGGSVPSLLNRRNVGIVEKRIVQSAGGFNEGGRWGRISIIQYW